MVRRRRSGRPRLLTEVELELMSELWQLGEATVRDVMSRLRPARKLAYTSVSTVLRILEQKKLVKSRKDSKAHVYRPALSKAEYERRSLRHLVDNVFDGTPSALVQRLLDDDGLSPADIADIRRHLEEKSQ